MTGSTSVLSDYRGYQDLTIEYRAQFRELAGRIAALPPRATGLEEGVEIVRQWMAVDKQGWDPWDLRREVGVLVDRLVEANQLEAGMLELVHAISDGMTGVDALSVLDELLGRQGAADVVRRQTAKLLGDMESPDSDVRFAAQQFWSTAVPLGIVEPGTLAEVRRLSDTNLSFSISSGNTDLQGAAEVTLGELARAPASGPVSPERFFGITPATPAGRSLLAAGVIGVPELGQPRVRFDDLFRNDQAPPGLEAGLLAGRPLALDIGDGEDDLRLVTEAELAGQIPNVSTALVDGNFWDNYTSRLTQEQVGDITTFIQQGEASGRAVEVTAIEGAGTFQLYTDTSLASVADRMAADPQNRVAGLNIGVSSELRTLAPEAFQQPALRLWDPMLGDYAGSESGPRAVSINMADMEQLKPVSWVALSYNRNLTVDHILNQGVLAITINDDRGTVTLIFA